MAKINLYKGDINRIIGVRGNSLFKGDLDRDIFIAPASITPPAILPGINNINGVTIANMTSFNGVVKANIDNINGVS